MPTAQTVSNIAPELSLEERRNFLRLPVEERRRILEEQAEAMVAHYNSAHQVRERMEWEAGDIVDY